MKGLKTYFFTTEGIIKAVDDVSFDVGPGEILGIVGGEILSQGKNLLQLNRGKTQHFRGQRISMIFQDPLTSLNPVLKIGTQLTKGFLRGMSIMGEPLIQVRNLVKHFVISKQTVVKAVDGIHFDVQKEKTLGLVGESDCGKTTTCCLLLRLISPTSGKVLFDGKDLSSLHMTEHRTELRKLRRHMQMVFQDSHSSLNPRMTVGSILSFPMRVHNLYEGKRAKRISELLELVGLNTADANRYPHEFSGGQLQRIGIARALAVDPIFILADEPVSSPVQGEDGYLCRHRATLCERR